MLASSINSVLAPVHSMLTWEKVSCCLDRFSRLTKIEYGTATARSYIIISRRFVHEAQVI
jgi:hypothetical protein